MGTEYRARMQLKQAKEQEEKKKMIERRCCLLRWMTAGMLFLVLAIAFYFDFSYHGFNKEYVEWWLQNDTRWNAVTTQIYQLISRIPHA
ncbi:MAG: hypothetical protein Q4D32_04825 [Eubacteriales bacterium]|nr:hypothetical protein [Eubacteriales bacterium]